METNYFEITSGGHKLIPTTAAVAANSMIDVILYDSTGLRVGDRKGKENREVYFKTQVTVYIGYSDTKQKYPFKKSASFWILPKSTGQFS